jgi:hypothetical protein
MFQDPRVWEAVKDVKDMLLAEKTISGGDVRAIVKKQYYPDLISIEVTKQLCFRYRKNRFNGYWGSAPFALGINIHTDHYYNGYQLREPQYVRDITKANAQPTPYPTSRLAWQIPFSFPIPRPVPAYVTKVLEENAQPIPFPCPNLVQAALPFPAPVSVKKPQQKKGAPAAEQAVVTSSQVAA